MAIETGKSLILGLVLGFLSFSLVFSALGCSKAKDSEQNLTVFASTFDEDRKVADKVFALINQERVKEGLPALKTNLVCDQSAQSHSEDMVERGFFSHDSPSENFQARMTRWGLDRAVVSENIAQAETPEDAVKFWMENVTYRTNIMNVLFKSMGVGFHRGLFTHCFYGR